MKILVPHNLAAALIGRGGANIKELQRQCQARLQQADAGELLGRPDLRLVTTRADSEESLNQVAAQVIAVLAEVANRTPSDLICSEGQLKLSALLPRALVGAFKGAGGGAIRRLCEESSAMIRIRDPSTSPGSAGGGGGGRGGAAAEAAWGVEVQARGCAEALQAVLREVNCLVQTGREEAWFAPWAAVGAAAPAAARPAEAPAAAWSPEGGSHSSSGADGKVSEEATNGGSLPSKKWCVLKLLVPQVLAATIIGHGGSNIAEIQRVCDARLNVSPPGETYSRTDCRVLLVRAESEEALSNVVHRVIEFLQEIAERDPSDSVCWEGQLKLGALVPRAVVAALIGRKGAAIRQLCEESGAEVKVRDPLPNATGPGAVQKVDIRGQASALEHVLRDVAHHVQQASGEEWFPAWASSPMGPAGSRGAAVEKQAPQTEKGSAARAGIELVDRTMDSLPPYVMEETRGFAMNCVVPTRLVGPVMGRGGSGIQEVQSTTKTRIMLREIPGDPENRSVNISGPILNVCSAYMLMMKRYLDAEKLDARDRSDAR